MIARPFVGSCALLLSASCFAQESADPNPASTAEKRAADRVLINAAVYTVDAKRSWAEAVAIRDETIVYVGDNAGALQWRGESTQLHDLTGSMLLPGFHDSHTHLATGGLIQLQCSLLEAGSLDEIKAQLARCRDLPGLGEARWITGAGWDNKFFEQGAPSAALLDQVIDDRPVFLESVDGHSSWANSMALGLAGIDRDTPDPQEGHIVRDPVTGEPWGTLREAAALLVKSIIPTPSAQVQEQGLARGITMAQAVGITSTIEPGASREDLLPFQALASKGGLKLHVLASLSPRGWQPGSFDDAIFELVSNRAALARENLAVDSVKIYADGVLESGNAALLNPYEGAAAIHGTGRRFYSNEAFQRYIVWLDAQGVQVHVHAIGDGGARQALDAFELARKSNGERGNRHHIVHLQLVDPADIPRFAELNVTANFQAWWGIPDEWTIGMAGPIVGSERLQRMYPIGSLARAGARIVGGSDWWVSPLNPLPAIEAAVRRQDPALDEGAVLNAQERVDLDTMIAAYTINGAWLVGAEQERGSIEVGKRADLVVLDQNLFEIPATRISDVKVQATLFGGEVVAGGL